MRFLALALFLAGCSYSGPQLAQTNTPVRLLFLENPTENHLLVKVQCEGAYMGGKDADQHDYLLHPRSKLITPVAGAMKPCEIVGFVATGPRELCAGSSK